MNYNALSVNLLLLSVMIGLITYDYFMGDWFAFICTLGIILYIYPKNLYIIIRDIRAEERVISEHNS